MKDREASAALEALAMLPPILLTARRVSAIRGCPTLRGNVVFLFNSRTYVENLGLEAMS